MDASAYENFEVLGASITAYAQAFRHYPSLLGKYFTFYGLSDLEDSVLADQWLPMAPWVRGTHGIVQEVGASTVYTIGKRITDTAQIPPTVDSVTAMLRTLDVVYHLHHRRGGTVMFDPSTGTMLDGIGQYRCEVQENGSSAHMYCDNPYPCDLDRGILAGFAGRYEPAISVTHHGSECRKKGDVACTYLVQW